MQMHLQENSPNLSDYYVIIASGLTWMVYRCCVCNRAGVSAVVG